MTANRATSSKFASQVRLPGKSTMIPDGHSGSSWRRFSQRHKRVVGFHRQSSFSGGFDWIRPADHSYAIALPAKSVDMW